MNDKLKPCPFCGMMLEWSDDDKGYWHPQNKKCVLDEMFFNSEEIEKQWNTRASQPEGGKGKKLLQSVLPWIEGILTKDEDDRAGDPLELLEGLIEAIKEYLSNQTPATLATKETGEGKAENEVMIIQATMLISRMFSFMNDDTYPRSPELNGWYIEAEQWLKSRRSQKGEE